MELKELDWKKEMIDFNRLYLQRYERGRGLIALENCEQVEEHSYEKYLSTSKEKMLKKVSRNRIIENNKYGKSKQEIHKENRKMYEGKPLHGQLQRD